jgi:hypothetical protein
MSIKKDEEIEQAYRIFGEQHGRRREELLARLARENAGVSGSACPPGAPGLRLGRWMLGSALGVAAMVLVGVTAWQLLAPPDPGAAGNLMSAQVSIVKSVFVRGWYDDAESRPNP